MKTKKFKDYVEKRLGKSEVREIEAAAKLEAEGLKAMQQDVAVALTKYMQTRHLGFNDVVRKLGKSPSQVAKIIKGEANLTLMTVAQIFSLMQRKPHIAAR